jgi:hypothetical protein
MQACCSVPHHTEWQADVSGLGVCGAAVEYSRRKPGGSPLALIYRLSVVKLISSHTYILGQGARHNPFFGHNPKNYYYYYIRTGCKLI